ncbi:hypothetical protein [Longimicrobium sp.]|uniref:DUF3108 domain-containing protein n=1 Tax=Longimicrobium sp. TaxID=2029185 RepID=UPI002E2F3356|nr:hypothetical protein [Longimicrobium sp.]HEX6041062.1 hypothetical protein [Longimicrobium sp.]
MPLRVLLLAALACAPALRAQSPVLQPERLVPSTDTMYVVQGGRDTIATTVQTLRRVTVDGRDLWQVEYAFDAGVNLRMADTTTFDVATLLPHAQVRVGGGRRLEVAFAGTEARLRTRDGADEPAEVVRRFEQPLFAGSTMDVIYRALPLAEGYATRIPYFLPESPVARWIDVRVTGPEDVPSRGGAVRAWRVEAGSPSGSPDVFWIAVADRAFIRAEHPGGMTTIR